MNNTIETTKPRGNASVGMGFGDWRKAASENGLNELVRQIDLIDNKDSLGGRNARRMLIERLSSLGLPTEDNISCNVNSFLEYPEGVFESLQERDYYFVSIIPGVHLAHGDSKQDVYDFINFAQQVDSSLHDKEMYLSSNGEPVMSGHIFISESTNIINAEFTIGNFNDFHRGLITPEIIIRRDNLRFDWSFINRLSTDNDWRDDKSFECNGDVLLTRSQMAENIFRTINMIPNDNGYFMPGYYEVLLERGPYNSLKTSFIEAVQIP